MANIKDNQLRGIVLQRAYERRKEGFFAWTNDDFKDLDPSIDFDLQDLFRACEQLKEHGLLEFKSVPGIGGQILDGRVKISAFGVDVIEGVAAPSLSISFDQSRHVTVSSSSNVQIGDANVQNVKAQFESLVKAIDSTSATESEKKEAKTRLQKFLEHPLVASIVGNAVSSLRL